MEWVLFPNLGQCDWLSSHISIALFTQLLHFISGVVVGSSMVIHTERSLVAVQPCNSHRNPGLQLLKRHGTHHVDDIGVS